MVTTTSLGVTCSARQPGPDRCLQPNVARRTMHSPPPLSSSRARAKGPRARVSRARVYPPPPHSSGAEPTTQRSESPKHHPIYSIGALLVDVLETSRACDACISPLPLSSSRSRAVEPHYQVPSTKYQKLPIYQFQRSSTAEYGMLFNEYDVDSSGSMNLVLCH